MSHIYVTSSGNKLGIKGGRLEISHKDELVRSVPKETIESISIFGNSNMTTACMQFALERGISVSFFSGKGKYYGRLESVDNHKRNVLGPQIRMTDDEGFCVDMARKVVSAKIRNQEVVIRRYAKPMNEEIYRNLNLIRSMRKQAESAETLEEIRGCEGMAARTYFDIISGVIDPEFKFYGRTRRPPRDRFNSLLSLGYTLLMHEIYAYIEVEGMSPYHGFLHSEYWDSPALTSDMIEEWRPVIIDSLVIGMIQNHEIKREHFDSDDESDGIFLNRDGMNKFVNKYEKKMNTTIKYLVYDEKERSVRDSVKEQCSRMRESFNTGDGKAYMPVIIR